MIFLCLILAADASVDAPTYQTSLLQGGMITCTCLLLFASAYRQVLTTSLKIIVAAVLVSSFLAIQALMPNKATETNSGVTKAFYWLFFFPSLACTKLLAIVLSREINSQLSESRV